MWETVVVYGVYPYVDEAKSPEYRWGSLHHQLEQLVQRLGVGGNGYTSSVVSDVFLSKSPKQPLNLTSKDSSLQHSRSPKDNAFLNGVPEFGKTPQTLYAQDPSAETCPFNVHPVEQQLEHIALSPLDGITWDPYSVHPDLLAKHAALRKSRSQAAYPSIMRAQTGPEELSPKTSAAKQDAFSV